MGIASVGGTRAAVGFLLGFAALVCLVGLVHESSSDPPETQLAAEEPTVQNGDTRFVLKPAAPGTLNIHVFPNQEKHVAIVEMTKALANRVADLADLLNRIKKVMPATILVLAHPNPAAAT